MVPLFDVHPGFPRKKFRLPLDIVEFLAHAEH
jgi:hypothetical protein